MGEVLRIAATWIGATFMLLGGVAGAVWVGAILCEAATKKFASYRSFWCFVWGDEATRNWQTIIRYKTQEQVEEWIKQKAEEERKVAQ